MKLCRHLLSSLSLAAILLGQSTVALAADESPTIQTLAARPLLPSASHPWNGRDWLERFYAPRGYAPVWNRQQAEAALALLAQAPAEGLDPGDYHNDELRRLLDDGQVGQPRRDVAFTTAMLHYLADLRLGRVRSEYHTAGADTRLARFDPVELLRGALANGRLSDAVAAAEPQVPLYGRVKQALARYRELAHEPQPRLPSPRGTIGVGDRYAAVDELHDRLALLGDLAGDEPGPQDGLYDATLAEGVRRFQGRHGLPETGELGAATVAALNVPLDQRVRELELTLERLRWIPDLPAGPMVAVNLPAYRLWAFDRANPAAQPLEMRVIVGQAVKTPTPLFIGQMRYLEFNPYWNVPRSITLKEVIPKLERNHGYLDKNDMELVGQGGVTTTVSAETIAELRAGKLRVRQRPGPKNSLGAIKFAMPNPQDIYLHSTPNREFFLKSRRDLSHGCIRVEQPAELARFVLRNDPRWDIDQIQAALEPGPTRRVDLPAVVPVVLFYATALAGRDGKALFARDIYQRDPKLEQALREHSDEAASK